MATTRRFRYRVYPDAEQAAALARAFGCARVVFNDFVHARETAREAGLPFPTTAVLSARLITLAKGTPEREWLGEVSAVVLQQALRDADRAYRNFFACLAKKRKGPAVGRPRYKSKRDNRQSIRFTNNARYTIRQVSTERALLRLPRIGGGIPVRLSRHSPPPRRR